MIPNALQRLLCRFTGTSCSPDRPSTSDIKSEMKKLGRITEAKTVELRLRRNALEATISGRGKIKHG